MKPEIFRTKSFVEDAATFIESASKADIEQHGSFRIALSGGDTPRPVYQSLAPRDCRWSKWIITFSDERCVPPDSPESNYRMALESLLMFTNPGEILRLQGELAPEVAADRYEGILQSYVSRPGEKRYVHDLVLLGLGDDGHTASLFPGTAALEEKDRNVVSNFVPKFNTSRLTFTFPLINSARRVVFLVNDEKKEPVVQKVLEGGHGLPAERVKPENGELIWFLGKP